MSKPEVQRRRKRREPHGAATLQDVATLAGVAPMTVSRSLRDPDLVSPKTRERVQWAINELNYIPNLLAGSLSSQSSRVIGIVVPSIRHSIFAETLQVMMSHFEEHGYRTFSVFNDYSVEREEVLVRTLLSHKPDALVLTGYTHTDTTARLLRSLSIPVVEMWNLGPDPIDMMVGIDNERAAYEMTSHLLDSGRRHLAMAISRTDGNDRSVARIKGFRKALTDRGLDETRLIIIETDIEYGTGAAAVDEILQRDPETDSVFMASDILAVGGLLRLQEKGVSVPEDVAIAGFDDAELASLVTPA